MTGPSSQQMRVDDDGVSLVEAAFRWSEAKRSSA